MMGGMLAAAAELSGGVMLPAFMSALVTAAFRRANPSWTPGAPPQPSSAPALMPAPAALEMLLSELFGDDDGWSGTTR